MKPIKDKVKDSPVAQHFIKENYEHMEVKEIAAELEIAPQTVTVWAKKLGLNSKKYQRMFSNRLTTERPKAEYSNKNHWED